MEVLVIDGANVVGSRPDGWWRDRAAAASRLREQVGGAGLPYDEVLLVLEGDARRGNPAGRVGDVLTIHAGGSGDDAVVDAARAQVTAGHAVVVVTADRALRERVEAVGASTASPSWLLGQL